MGQHRDALDRFILDFVVLKYFFIVQSNHLDSKSEKKSKKLRFNLDSPQVSYLHITASHFPAMFTICT